MEIQLWLAHNGFIFLDCIRLLELKLILWDTFHAISTLHHWCILLLNSFIQQHFIVLLILKSFNFIQHLRESLFHLSILISVLLISDQIQNEIKFLRHPLALWILYSLILVIYAAVAIRNGTLLYKLSILWISNGRISSKGALSPRARCLSFLFVNRPNILHFCSKLLVYFSMSIHMNFPSFGCHCV